MGNQQANVGGGILPSTCLYGRRRSLTRQVGSYRRLSLCESETASVSSCVGSVDNTDDEAGSIHSEDNAGYDEWLTDSQELENAILSENVDQLQKICDERLIDINIELNEKGETALILSVKLSQIEMVKALLLTPKIDKNSLNAHDFSPLDVALVTAFDNRLEPRQTICWEIIECLLQVGAEPNNKDAMMYIVRTALKYCDEKFLYRLILLTKELSYSIKLHELLLQKLHRYQPVYIESLDPFFVCTSEFTIKLLKNANGHRLCDIVNTMRHYLESYWNCRSNKLAVFQKLILYATAAGWDWTPQQMDFINRVCPEMLSRWCANQKKYPISLSHLARKSFRRNSQCQIAQTLKGLPFKVPESLKGYIMLKDVDEYLSEAEISIVDVRL